ALERRKRREDLLPVLAVRRLRARAQGLELGRGDEDAGMHADELRFEADGMRKEVGEGRDGFRGRGGNGGGQDWSHHGEKARGQDHPLISNRWILPARTRTDRSPNGPSSAAAANTGVYPI